MNAKNNRSSNSWACCTKPRICLKFPVDTIEHEKPHTGVFLSVRLLLSPEMKMLTKCINSTFKQLV